MRDHRSRALRNARLSRVVYLVPGLMDWAVTILFYAALHHLESFLATRGIHCKNHLERERQIIAEKRLDIVYNDYEDLKNYSVNARYEMAVFQRSEVRWLWTEAYPRIRQCIAGLTAAGGVT